MSDNARHIANITLQHEDLRRAMGLPDDAEILAVFGSEEINDSITIRVGHHSLPLTMPGTLVANAQVVFKLAQCGHAEFERFQL